MPIKKRQKSGTGFYHVIVKGINNELIYNQHRERNYFKKIILKHLIKYQTEIYAFCIMSNHAHFIIRAELQDLSMFMAVILAEYAAYYNYKHHRNGHVFQNRFISECIESERYFWNCVRYIHMNPVKACMVKLPLSYKYSSMMEYYSKAPIIIHENALAICTKHFGDGFAFEEFHQLMHHDVFKDVPDEVHRQQLEVAGLIIQEMFEKYSLNLKREIIEEKHLRDEYISKIEEELGLSKRKTIKLYDKIKNIVENK